MNSSVSDYLPLAGTDRSSNRQYQTDFCFVSGRCGIAACAGAIRIFKVSLPRESTRVVPTIGSAMSWVMTRVQNGTSILSPTLEPMN
jgi:hypothetical protein